MSNWHHQQSMDRVLFAWLALFVLVIPSPLRAVDGQQGSEPLGPVFEISRVASVKINGDLEDWKEQGVLVATMSGVRAKPLDREVLPPALRLGWDDRGLYAALKVSDTSPHEHDYVRHLFKGDSVEFFVSRLKGSSNRYMLLLSPGRDPKHPEPRHCFFPDPSEQAKDMSGFKFEMARTVLADGYAMEVFLPWSNLNISARPGEEFGLQVYAMDADADGKVATRMWHPAGSTQIDPDAVQRVRLSDAQAKSILVTAAADQDPRLDATAVRIVGAQELVGKAWRAEFDGNVLFGKLLSRNAQAYAAFDVPKGTIPHISVAGREAPMLSLPPTYDLQTIALELDCRFMPCVFDGDEFPTARIMGVEGYRVAGVSYFDSRYIEVRSAKEPGRYGAVVTLMSREGGTTKRFRTLFRTPTQLGGWDGRRDLLDTLPRHAAEIASQRERGRDFSWLLKPDAAHNPLVAALLSRLYEVETGLTTHPRDDAGTADARWWIGLKRKLYGMEARHPGSFVCPRPLEGPAMPVIRMGDAHDAGMKKAALDSIDAVCRAGVEESGEPIAVCIARHGVVFFHRAYGSVGGRPMTVDTRCPMHSQTKPLAGALMMMVVDQGLVNLEDTLDKHLAPFRGIEVAEPVTIRNLYSHTSGLMGHWGDDLHDTEEIIASFYPTLRPGRFNYDGTGFALGGKIIEQVTNEPILQFFRRHLLEPLGMSDTEVVDSSAGASSTALDYARFGQMLLNRGAYGDKRFFGERTFRRMVPSGGSDGQLGIGLAWRDSFGLARGTFGRDAANSGVFRVDPTNDLVIVLTSAGERKDFEKHFPALFRAILEGIDPDDAAKPQVRRADDHAATVPKVVTGGASHADSFSGAYTTSWIGNTIGEGGIFPGSDGYTQRHVQQDIDSIWVSPDGTVFAYANSEENHLEAGIYRDGKLIGNLAGLRGRASGVAICGNSNHIFVAIAEPSTKPDGGNAASAPAALCVRRYKNVAPFPISVFPDGAGDGSFLIVNRGIGNLKGLAADDHSLFIADPIKQTVEVHDCETMKHVGSWPLERAANMAVDASGNVWVIQEADASVASTIVRYSRRGRHQLTISLERQTRPTALCVDRLGRLLIADAGPDQNIKIYDPARLSGSPTLPVGTLGTKGGAFSAGSPETVGRYEPLRFNHPTGVGSDAAGNTYVSANGQGKRATRKDFNDQGLGAILESYDLGGRLRWVAMGLAFVDCAESDPMFETDVYTAKHRFRLDYGKGVGEEWKLQAFLYNPFKYPNDCRLNRDNTNRGLPFMRRIDGRLFMFLTDMWSSMVAVYRFDRKTDGEVAVPCGLIVQKPFRDAPWIRFQPKRGEWIWWDRNGNGDFDDGEFAQQDDPHDAPEAWGYWVDERGDIWQATRHAGIRRFPCMGIHDGGSLKYDYRAMEQTRAPDDFVSLERLEYRAATDTMYLSGYTRSKPNRQEDWGALGTTIVRYDNWSSPTRSIHRGYPLELTYDSKSRVPKSMCTAGGHLFVFYYARGGMPVTLVFDSDTAAQCATLTPGREVNSAAGDCDVPNGIRALRRESGEYVVFQEDDRYGKVLMYRWNPGP